MTINKGANWGGLYSRFSFSEIQRYFALLKEVGKPVLDDDFNFAQDASITQIRRVVGDFFGRASPNAGFQIVANTNANDFAIKGGGGDIESAGVIYAGGLRATLLSDTTYQGQEVAGPSLTPPATGTRVDLVYLDAYLDEVGPAADASMVDPTLNVETSRRLKLMQLIRVAQGGTASDYVDANGLQHYITPLATITRSTSPNITADMIVDLRPVLASAASQTAAGPIKIASPADVAAGTDNTKAVTAFDLFNSTLGAVPIGGGVDYFGGALPANFIALDGSTISRATYPELFAVIGTTYGAGDGSTTFTLPDSRGRTTIGDGQGAGLTNRTAGASMGSETNALAISNLPSHQHNSGIADDQSPAQGDSFFVYGATTADMPGNASVTIDSETGKGVTYQGLTSFVGGGSPIDNMQPSSSCQKIDPIPVELQ